MHTINEIASWFKKNNELASSDELRTKVLSLYSLVAFKTSNINVEYEELTYQDNNFNLGITSYDENPIFNEQENKILQIINRVYGYIRLDNLFMELSYAGKTIEEISKFLKESIKEDLEMYENHDFNETVLVTDKLVFFINNDTQLTDDEIMHLKEKQPYDEQTLFSVYRDEETNKLVIY